MHRHKLHKHVRFLGYLPDDTLAILYRLASVFVFPSLYEGFGLPPLEAMASGTPVVTSNVSSLPESAGDAAVLVDPYDVGAIETGMRRVLTDPALAAEMRRKGLLRARQFSWEQSVAKTWEMYQEIGRQETGDEGAGPLRARSRRRRPVQAPVRKMPASGAPTTSMRVALVHDWLTGMRGGEKVLEVLCELYPDADLFTLFHKRGSVSPLIERRRIETSFVQHLPFAARRYRWYLPLFPLAVTQFRFDGYDLVISTSHCAVKAIRPAAPRPAHLLLPFADALRVGSVRRLLRP